MNSYIFGSTACKTCSTRVDQELQRVLRTATQEICTNCGAVINSFPGFVMTPAANNDLLAIPAPVSTIVEELLQRRLFTVAMGINPRLGQRIGEHVNAPAHRTGEQALLELNGFGNTEATIRWNFSDANLYATAQRGAKSRGLHTIDWLMPARLRRAAEFVASKLDFKSATVSDSWSGERFLRFEKSFPLDEQPLSTAKLCLVVKVELSWLQVGETLPSEEGSREFFAGNIGRRPFQTIEEALDRALNVFVHRRRQNCDVAVRRAGQKGDDRVCDFSRESFQGFGLTRRKPCTPNAHLGESISSSRTNFHGPASNLEGEFYPTGLPMLFLHPLHESRVTVDFNGERVAETTAKRGDPVSCSIELSEKLGERTGTVVVTYDDHYITTLKIVSQEEYERVIAQVVEQLKIEKLGEIKRTQQFRDQVARTGRRGATWLPSDTLSAGDQVAVELAGRWYEGTYEWRVETPGEDKDVEVTTSSGSIVMVTPSPQMWQSAISHVVRVSSHGGEARWRVPHVKRLADALREGLDVIPPFDSRLAPTLEKLISFVPGEGTIKSK